MSIIQALRVVQDAYGYLPDEALRALADRLGVRLHRLQEVASFFPHFRRQKPPDTRVFVCRDMACHLAGASRLLEQLRLRAAGHPGLAVEEVSCLGRCDRAPVVSVEKSPLPASPPDPIRIAARAVGDAEASPPHFYFWSKCDAARSRDLVNALLNPSSKCEFDGDETHQLATNKWLIDIYATDGLPHYEAARRLADELQRDGALAIPRGSLAHPVAKPHLKGGSYDTVKGFLESCYPRSVCGLLEQLDIASLRGMGGAGQRAFEKWIDVLIAPGDVRYVVANGDESEPGTFKDRELIIRTPHLIVEGLILAGLLLGAQHGYIYVRHEYAEGIHKLREAIRAAEKARLCGARILDTERAFPIEVYVSPGGYICGEQSALLEAIEDKRAEPRNRPPELATNGLWDQPTLVSNVETFAWMPGIKLKGGEWYAELGANNNEGKKGRRFFSISGDVAKPGVYELAVGAPLRQLVFECAGGMRDPSHALKAIATSGPSGGFVPPVLKERDGTASDVLEIPLDIDVFRKFGLMLGAGLVVYDATRNIAEEALNCTRFFRNESCGKCVPCRIGSQKLVQIGEEFLERPHGEAERQEKKKLIDELASAMELASICGLGYVAPAPLKTLLRSFPGDLVHPRRTAG
jgi:NADH:ubiquinone oxidoreductase subunit F (NADH-binding)/NADH:ubiquinone oxidoreductase subunit E